MGRTSSSFTHTCAGWDTANVIELVDVLGLEHLADLLAHLRHALLHQRIRVVALQLRLNEAGCHAGHSHLGVQRLLGSASEKACTPNLVMLQTAAPAVARRPATDDTFPMSPPPLGAISGKAA